MPNRKAPVSAQTEALIVHANSRQFELIEQAASRASIRCEAFMLAASLRAAEEALGLCFAADEQSSVGEEADVISSRLRQLLAGEPPWDSGST